MKDMNVNPLAQYLTRALPEEGVYPTDVPGLSLIRLDSVTERRPIVYEPSLYIVAQGSKCAYLGDEKYVYDQLNYLVLSVPLPLQCMVTRASKDKPYLAMRIQLDADLLTELVIEMKSKPHGQSLDRGIFVSNMDNELLDSILRLVKMLNTDSASVLAPLAIKEALFHVLQGEQGDQLRAFAIRDRQHFQIATVLNYIQKNYASPMEVAELAEIASMSTSSFHQYFKAVTNASPVQYIKTIRLHEAKRKMLMDHLSASDAAYQVGYASPSQFSREYKRLFGESPAKDIEAARSA